MNFKNYRPLLNRGIFGFNEIRNNLLAWYTDKNEQAIALKILH